MIRFHLDEHVDPVVARALQARGCDVTTAVSVGMLGATDEEHLAFALRESRVVVTHDADFLRLHSAGVDHAGIAYCHAGARSTGEIVQVLSLIAACLSEEEMHRHVEYL